MAIDGILIHHLVDEIKPKLIGGRINKIIQSNSTDIVFQIHNNQAYNLLISMSYTAPRLYITTEKQHAPLNPFNLCMVLRKYLERGIINDIIQVDNDRIVIIKIDSKNELGDDITYNLIVEIMGRSSNLILTDPSYKIIDVMKKHFPSNAETSRIMIPKATYTFPEKRSLLNPFINTKALTLNDLKNLEGISKVHLAEIQHLGSVQALFDKQIIPTLYVVDNKKIFSPYSLDSLVGEKTTFNSISELLEYCFKQETKQENPDYSSLVKLINHKLTILRTKIDNLNNDLDKAHKHLDDLNKAQLLQAHLYEIKKGQKEIELESFDGEKVYTISLDPLKSATQNMQKYFKNYKKSVSAQTHIAQQLEKTNNEIEYLNTILSQIEFVNHQELLEIKHELVENGYLKDTSKKYKKVTPSIKNINHYEISYAKFYVGKNNLQNNFLTHNYAKKIDYWFHVKDMPSAHVIVQTDNLDERVIRIAANLAALNSKYEKSSSVAVDYTQVKNIKKIPNRPGCFVTYTNQKTIYIDPSIDILNKLLKENS